MDDGWPEHLLAKNHPTREWRSRPDSVWESIRQDYLAGAGARDLCHRYDVGLSTLRLKAREGGWRRGDQADSDLFPADADRWVAEATGPDSDTDDEGGAGPEEDWADLAERARFRLRRAIGSGRAAEAASWLRVHDRLRALAAAEAAAANPPAPEPVPAPPRRPEPDPFDTALSVARQVGAIARRAAARPDEATMTALEAAALALDARVADLAAASGMPGAAPALDSLDSLDPLFSEPPPAPPRGDREILLRTRERRLDLGLGVADLDQALAALDREEPERGLSP